MESENWKDDFIKNSNTGGQRFVRILSGIGQFWLGVFLSAVFVYTWGMAYWMLGMTTFHIHNPWVLNFGSSLVLIGFPIVVGWLLIIRRKIWAVSGMVVGSIPLLIYTGSCLKGMYQ